MMSLKNLSCFILLLAVSACTKPAKNNAVAVKTLHDLLDQNEYFKLDAQFKALSGDIEEKDRLYFKSYIDNAFNRNVECIKAIDSLLNDHGKELPDSTKAALKHLQADSYFKVFEYAKAADCDNDILKNYKKVLHKDFIDDISNDLLMRNALKEIPAQQTIKKTNTTISWKRDAIGLVEIPVVSHAKTFDGIFDTRANISSITQTYAQKLGLRMLNVSYNEGSGATGITFKTGMGIADSLYIGDILVKNVVFQVMPDSILYIAPIKFQLNIIIGFPVIEQLQEVHVYKNGKMMIPEIPAKSDLHNFALDGLDPVIELKSGNDTLAFHFDSGAVTSMFYQSYFNKYKATVLKTATKKTVGFGGAGGMQKKEVYILPKVNLTVGNKTVAVDSISVLTKPITPGEKFYGNIGQDFTNQFNEVIYNFKDMYIKGL